MELRQRISGLMLVVAMLMTSCSVSVEVSGPGVAPTPNAPESSASEPETVVATSTPVAGESGLVADALQTLVDDFVGSGPGGVDVLVSRGGEVLRASAGDANAQFDPIQPGMSFRVGSISKPFTSVIVLQLVDEGLVDLDATLATYLPATRVGADITIRQLLSHRSGLANYTAQPLFFAETLTDRSRVISPDDVLDYVVEAAGGVVGSYSYSNTNFILLGQLIERLDGGDVNDSLRRRITEPLGLTKTFFDTGQPAGADLAGGWSRGVSAGETDSEYTAIATGAWTAGSLISTTDDLVAFLEGLQSGRLLSADSFQAMSQTTGGYGLGIADIGLGPGTTGIGHGGAIPGYLSSMAIDVESGDAIVILANSDALDGQPLALDILAEW